MIPRLCVFLFLLQLRLLAVPQLGAWFTEGAVLQQGKPIPVWGSAEPGEAITLSFLDYSLQTVTDKNGRWVVTLPPLEASTQPATLRIQGSTTLEIGNIVVGEVWVYSGQSLIQKSATEQTKPLRPETSEQARGGSPQENKASGALAGAAQLRLARMSPSESNQAPVLCWENASTLSAVRQGSIAVQLGERLLRKTKLAIGIVDISLPECSIESWLSKEALFTLPNCSRLIRTTKQRLTHWPQAQRAHEEALRVWTKNREISKARGALDYAFFQKKFPEPKLQKIFGLSENYEQGLRPLLPGVARGFIWLHGESGVESLEDYETILRGFTVSLPTLFNDPQLSLIFVQSLAYPVTDDASNEILALLRERQACVLEYPHTSLITAVDLSPLENQGEVVKEELARRIAQFQLSQIYSLDAFHEGPIVATVCVDGSTVTLDFLNAESGLIAYKHPLTAFELCGADGVFHRAEALIVGPSIQLSTSQVKSPKVLRYAWKNNPLANLYNGSGMPAPPLKLNLSPKEQPKGTDSQEQPSPSSSR